jgi:hypothetical protein
MGLSHVSISAGNLSSEEYSRSYTELSRCIFLYDISDFEYQSSARFIDCHYAGVPVMVSKKFSMVDEYNNCTLINTFDDDGISAILSFIKSSDLLAGHDCQNQSNSFELQWSKIRNRMSCDPNGLLRPSFPIDFTISIVVLCQYLLSFCTVGGTLNFATIKDKFRGFFNRYLGRG